MLDGTKKYKDYEMTDLEPDDIDYSPACSVINALLLVLPFWACVFALVWWLS
jgi:hypothetical protein